ncbi:MAG TPA: hypothetical protein VHR45_05180 [Thermoanaerobaculia bacterium]|nr:hypothetical protein [Thermoanaerobaculia bacterium]
MSTEMTVGMSAPPIGMIRSTLKMRESRAKTGNSQVHSGATMRTTPQRTARPEQRQVDEVLVAIGDRPGREDFLEPPERHQVAGERPERVQIWRQTYAELTRSKLAVTMTTNVGVLSA